MKNMRKTIAIKRGIKIVNTAFLNDLNHVCVFGVIRLSLGWKSEVRRKSPDFRLLTV